MAANLLCCNTMNAEELRQRTAEFARRVIKFVRPLLNDQGTRHAASQLLRAATSVAANYRSACVARSHREFTSRLGIVLEEADESKLWVGFLQNLDAKPSEELKALSREAHELTAIFAASCHTSRRRGQALTGSRGRKRQQSDGPLTK